MTGDDMKSHCAIHLALRENPLLVSRASAKNALLGAELFGEIILDFLGVNRIGPAFADEIFRVFANDYPKIQLTSINANEQVTGMIRRAQSARENA